MNEQAQQFWFNTRTGEVEEGKQSISSERLGPFDTAEAASRAPERLAERARDWAAEEQAVEEADWGAQPN